VSFLKDAINFPFAYSFLRLTESRSR